MAKYYVTYRIEGRYTAEVEAPSIEAARKEAVAAYETADFGELRDVGECGGTEQVSVEDEEGNIVWES